MDGAYDNTTMDGCAEEHHRNNYGFGRCYADYDYNVLAVDYVPMIIDFGGRVPRCSYVKLPWEEWQESTQQRLEGPP